MAMRRGEDEAVETSETNRAAVMPGRRATPRRACLGLAAAAGLTLLPGCNLNAVRPITVVDRAAYTLDQTRVFTGLSRERLIGAAEAVVRASGDFAFVNGLNGFSARQPFLVYGGLGSAFPRDRIDFEVESTPDGWRASVAITDAGDFYGSLAVARYEAVPRDGSVYALFWRRVEIAAGRPAQVLACEAPDPSVAGRRGGARVGSDVACAFELGYGVAGTGRDPERGRVRDGRVPGGVEGTPAIVPDGATGAPGALPSPGRR